MGDQPHNPELENPVQQLAERMAQLKAAPVVELVGLVDASGPSAFQMRGQWTFGVNLAGWKSPANGVLRTSPLRLVGEVSKEVLDARFKSLPALAVIRVRARIGTQPPAAGHALVEELLGPARDGELEAEAARLRLPVTHQDDRFGTLTLDRRVNWFEGMAPWGRRSIKLMIPAEEGGGIQAGLATAHDLWDREEAWTRQARQRLVTDLLQLKNDRWLDDNEAPLSAEEFLGRVEADSILVRPGGLVEMWFLDGDMFSGHSLVAKGIVQGGPERADLEG